MTNIITDREFLRVPCKKVKFPLTEEDRIIIQRLKAAFRTTPNCAGLAANQIGYDKAIIVFKRKGKEVVWINPSYIFAGKNQYKSSWTARRYYDVTQMIREGCLSLPGCAGFKERFVKIKYRAINVRGKKVNGEESGYIAQIIQHEVDHINGKLMIDKGWLSCDTFIEEGFIHPWSKTETTENC